MTAKLSTPFAPLRALHSMLDRRAQRRRQAFCPTVILSQNGAVQLHLLDVSTHGARGYAVNPPWTGMICELVLHDRQVRAEIVWVNYRSFGLRFVQPISDDLVERLSIKG